MISCEILSYVCIYICFERDVDAMPTPSTPQLQPLPSPATLAPKSNVNVRKNSKLCPSRNPFGFQSFWEFEAQVLWVWEGLGAKLHPEALALDDPLLPRPQPSTPNNRMTAKIPIAIMIVVIITFKRQKD